MKRTDACVARACSRASVFAAGVGAAMSTSAAAPASGPTIEEVTVSSTPLGGFELPLERVPGNVQQATSEELERVRRASLAQFLNQRLGSVFINEAQANPLQPDVQFRGFVASPLLGQPQGVAVYQDGVRINDPFGDIVPWALVPENAIESVELIPGSNPVFGLNALGGALALRTKSGFTHERSEVEVLGGSSDRVIAQFETGGDHDGRMAYFASARYLTENGWRRFSPSDALQIFTDLAWRNSSTSVDASLTWVDTKLIGNGPAPIQLLATDREEIYTHPDRTENSLAMLTLSGAHSFTPEMQLNALSYYRRSDVDTLNGDESDFAECELTPGFICEEDEDGQEIALDQAGAPIAFSPALEGALVNRSATNQDTYGASIQLGVASSLFERENRLLFGAALDRSDVAFESSAELGSFDDSRGALGGGVHPGESFVELEAELRNASAYVTNTFAVTPAVDLVLAARYNDTKVVLRDQLGEDLNGSHDFSRFNVAAGVSYRPSRAVSVYANYSESNRAPSPVELTCADEDDPCALPNAFLSDPPLEQVVGKTLEIGARGEHGGARWHLGVFETRNEDDILFISAGALTNRGFFDNVGDTRRRGVELNLQGALFEERMSWFAHYTWVQAQFRESFAVASPNNPAAVEGEILVSSGDTIPGVPERLMKAGVALHPFEDWTVSLDGSYQSGQYFRGDEGNLNAQLSGFTLLQLSAEWRALERLTLFAQIDNLTDERYATFGLYGASDEVLGDQFDDPRFLSPGAPRRAWVGFKWTL